MKGNEEIIRQTESLLRHGYSPISKNKSEEIVVALTSLTERYATGAISLRMILEETTKTIHRAFNFQYLNIVTRDSDGKYRYKTVVGMMESAKRAVMQIEYADSDLFDEKNYPSTKISDITRFYMSEGSPYKLDESESYSRPQFLNQNRKSPDEMLEGDYFDVFIKGPNDEILGYIEAGITRDSKFPDKKSIMWLEMVSRILGIILSNKND